MTERKPNDYPGKPPRHLQVDRARCPQDHACPAVQVCPASALKQQGHAAPTVDETACVVCGRCVRRCPRQALTLV